MHSPNDQTARLFSDPDTQQILQLQITLPMNKPLLVS